VLLGGLVWDKVLVLLLLALFVLGPGTAARGG